MKRVISHLQGKVVVTCPHCGKVIEVVLEGLSNYQEIKERGKA